MTNISVSTGPLAASASRLQAQSRSAGERAHGIEAVLRGLDLVDSESGTIDTRLRALRSQLTVHAGSASATTPASSASRRGAIGGGRGRPAARAAPELTPGARDASRAVAPSGAPVGRGVGLGLDVFGFGLSVVEEMSKTFSGLAKVVGTELSLAAAAAAVSKGDYYSAAWSGASALPLVGRYVGAAQFGLHLGEFIATDEHIQRWIVSSVPGGDMPPTGSLSIGNMISDTVWNAFIKDNQGAKDWLVGHSTGIWDSSKWIPN